MLAVFPKPNLPWGPVFPYPQGGPKGSLRPHFWWEPFGFGPLLPSRPLSFWERHSIHGNLHFLRQGMTRSPTPGCQIRAAIARLRLNKLIKGPALGITSRGLSDTKAVKDKPAAAIESARAKKYQTYNPLLYVIKKQVLDGRRRKEPKFTPAAVTTFGELGPGCTVVQEWLAMRLKAHLTSLSERPDGVSVSQVVGRFRADFRLSLMMVAVRRAAAMLLGSGLPGCCVREDVAASGGSVDF